MTVAALRVELESEEVLWGLTMMRKAERWERWETAERVVREHLRAPTRIRMPLSLLPDWYRALWWDPTQIDGRAEFLSIDSITVHLRGPLPRDSALETEYTVATLEFLDAVLAGAVGDAS